MRRHWAWVCIVMVLLTACDSGGTPASPTATINPSATAIHVYPGCDANQVYLWESKFHLPIELMDDISAVKVAEREFTDLPYPECVSSARSHAIAAFAALARITEAKVAKDELARIRYEEDLRASMTAFDAEMQRIRVTSVPPPTPAPTQTVVCPSLSYTCTQLTCAQAYACLMEGNISLDRNNNNIPCEDQCRP